MNDKPIFYAKVLCRTTAKKNNLRIRAAAVFAYNVKDANRRFKKMFDQWTDTEKYEILQIRRTLFTLKKFQVLFYYKAMEIERVFQFVIKSETAEEAKWLTEKITFEWDNPGKLDIVKIVEE